MLYQISSWNVSQTSTGKKLARAVLIDSEGNDVENVTVWGTFPGFELYQVSKNIEGEITVSVNGKFENKTLNAPKTGAVRRTKPDIEKAMEKKATNIAQAQDKKADSIKIAANARDATILTAQWLNMLTSDDVSWTKEDMKAMWVEMRKWLGENYGDNEAPF